MPLAKIDTSRRGRVHSLQPGQMLDETRSCPSMECIPTAVQRLNTLWRTACARVQQEHPTRKFALHRVRTTGPAGEVLVTMTVRRVA